MHTRLERTATGPTAGSRLRQPACVCGLALALLAEISSGSAMARLAQQQLSRVSASPPPGARIPADQPFEDAVSRQPVTLGAALAGRTALVLPVDYTCGNVCDPMLSMTAAALKATGLEPGADYQVVLLGIDPRDGADAARRMLRETAEFDATTGIAALVGDEAAVSASTGALGYTFAYDEGTDSFAHPAAALLIAPDGRVSRVLSPLALNGTNLRLALIEAGEGRIGTLSDRLTLLCYGFDPSKGVYTPLIRRILSLAAGATILAIGFGLLLLRRRERRA